MKTAVLIKRQILGGNISQNSKTEMFSATDLLAIGNKWRILNDMPPFSMKTWLQNKSTKEFIKELEERYGKGSAKKMSRGRGHHTWFHPLLFIDMALSISPKIKIEVYEWLFDNLVKCRNDGGDSYKKMCGTLYARCQRKTAFSSYMQGVANKIRLACGVTCWESATQEQNEKRKKTHEVITLLADVMNNNDEAVRLGILKALEIESNLPNRGDNK